MEVLTGNRFYKQQTGSMKWWAGGEIYAKPLWGPNVYLDKNGNWQIESSNGGESWAETALDHTGKTFVGIGILIKGREFAEWEYLRQVKFNRALSGDFSQPIKHSIRAIRRVGQGATILNGAISIAEFTASDHSWGDYGSLSIGLLSAGLTYTPEPVSSGIGIGIGLIDAFGGFNSLYQELDSQNKFYNSTGGIYFSIRGNLHFLFFK